MLAFGNPNRFTISFLVVWPFLMALALIPLCSTSGMGMGIQPAIVSVTTITTLRRTLARLRNEVVPTVFICLTRWFSSVYVKEERSQHRDEPLGYFRLRLVATIVKYIVTP